MIISYQHNRLHDRQIENHWIIDGLIMDCGETIYQGKKIVKYQRDHQHLKDCHSIDKVSVGKVVYVRICS